MTYIVTLRGHQMDYLHPRPQAVELDDIAHALSHMPRFCGHLKPNVSVGEHSVVAARVAYNHGLSFIAKAFLLHDAHEAYLGDLPTPLKRLLGEEYYRIQRRLQGAVHARFELGALPEEVQEAIGLLDNWSLVREAKAAAHGYSPCGQDSYIRGTTNLELMAVRDQLLGSVVEHWSPQEARWEFKHLFRELWGA